VPANQPAPSPVTRSPDDPIRKLGTESAALVSPSATPLRHCHAALGQRRYSGLVRNYDANKIRELT